MMVSLCLLVVCHWCGMRLVAHTVLFLEGSPWITYSNSDYNSPIDCQFVSDELLCAQLKLINKLLHCTTLIV